jgi:hypothetical protein
LKSGIKYILLLNFFSLFYFCKPTEEIITDSNVSLRFSSDTIEFDTVFTGQLSLTKRLKVYNTSENAIKISSIRLAGMENSFYSLIINGLPTNQTSNLLLRGKDSLFILATATIDQNNKTNPFLVTDSILFTTNSLEQRVYLSAYGQNASYYVGDTIKTNTIWDSTTARFIRKTVVVKQGISLTIEKGTKVHFVKDAGLRIAGTLIVKGDTNNHVVFQGPRLDPFYRNLPGLWKGLQFLPGSLNNEIDYAEIKNAETGIFIGDTSQIVAATLKITNSIIKNMSSHGLKAYFSDLTAWNCLIYNCAYNGFILSSKGSYKCYNNTFAFTYSDFNRFGSALEVSEGERTLELINNILWGNGFNNGEIEYKKQSGDLFKKNLIKSNNSNLTSDTSNFWNLDPLFVSENDSDPNKLNFSLDSLSPARGKGIKLLIFDNDLKGKKRTAKWDIGAYQFK